jgi:NAD(P)-dependent dehydrogenase (short-subunit alcohol dehydrogenase family)
MPNSEVFMITGAAGGIGAATATQAVRNGARVVLFDRGPNLEALAKDLGDAALAVPGDVTVLADQQRAVKMAISHFGRLDAMVANAGIEGTVAPLLEQTTEEFHRVLQVNVLGVFNSIKASAPSIGAGGSIVITSSVAGFIGSPGLGPYVTSKHAVVGLMRNAALELAERSIRVNTVHPGPVDNRMMRSIEEGAAPGNGAAVKAAFEAQVPMGRYAKNEEIAKLILWLCGKDSSYCTGQRFVADGGFLSQ